METYTELKAIKIINFAYSCSTLFFLDINSDVLYQLKDTNKQQTLSNWGTSRNVYITENDLINVGILNHINNDGRCIIIRLN